MEELSTLASHHENKGDTNISEDRRRAIMDSYIKETLWMVVVFFAMPHRVYSTVCPTDCRCQPNGAVKCMGLTITDVPRPLPVHTYLLQLEGTGMNVIKERSLANLNLMLRFSLTLSHLHTIHPRAFDVATQLRSIKLASNDLSTLPVGVFRSLSALEQLYLEGNQLDAITADMLYGLVGLRDLDLSRNRLTGLTSGVFDGLTNLTFLNLGRNSIKTLPPTIFHSLTNLSQLMLYNNELEALAPGMFDTLDNLEELKIHSNKIRSLPAQLFWPLRNLKILTLSSNQLQALPDRTFYHMPKITKLTIYNNPLLSLPTELMGHMPKITEFYLYSTNLSTVPGNLFANMSGLVTLKFHLNEMLKDLPPDLFCCLSILRTLSLKSNDLHYLHPQQFSNLTTLDTLFLSDNKLENLPEKLFYGLGELQSIDLMNNGLVSLPRDIFTANVALKNVQLSHNPWNCTCTIRDTANWIRRHEHVVLDRANVKCYSPAHWGNRTLSSLHEEELSYCDEEINEEPLLHIFSIQGPTAFVSSTNAPLQTTTQTRLATNQQVSVFTESSSLIPVASTTTTDFATTARPTEDDHRSPPFYDKMVFEEGPDFVHHNFYKGWVYVWFLPSNANFVGVLMFSHILLAVTGLSLILGAMYTMCKLNKIMEVLNTEST